ncbi:hypothetical protein [Streptomyces mirabilis]|uniref:hypothetical protein n=1 Tax=Streptomyces mirabilis TaxID=68239 RepID=UPI0036E16343
MGGRSGRATGPGGPRRRPALLGVHDETEDGTVYRAELSAGVDEAILSFYPVLHEDLGLSDSWWADLAGALDRLSVTATDRVAVRTQYM